MTLWVVGVVYLGLLTNWFRYGLSLEAIFVVIPLLLGVIVSSVFAVLAYRRNSLRHLVAAFVGATLTSLLVVAVQLHSFGEMPSLYANDVQKSPIGRIVTPQGDVEYWIELENPFDHTHREYVVIRRDAKQYRLKVPIFNGPAGGYLSATSASDWGQLEATSHPDVYLFKIGSFLPAQGSSFKINLATGVVETILRADG